ncbi:ABC-F family ATP-binding cassette domain-containing protein [Collinsella tanakaei]|uniref:ABC-F family ATP-binding cassette domain-containing protein n=1 Tax=Collinsella tanakaei TaxID=626935 RepID=UPI001F2BA190|nr:ABC-F family ATP-binding cassette domain-containing protein [Collinsella tanakaei]MCF2620976.1 ABC-F family ATP-binding cassette domain-containing protein [Collinsella tanakaei]
MAILLGCDSVQLEFPTKHIFNAVTLGVNEGDRIGIVGRNGDGKSTLLSVLAGELEPDDGRVTHRRDVRVGLLGQKDALDDDATVRQAVVGDAPEYEWASSPRVRQVLDGLIADVPWEGRVGDLSGGQRRRVDLARLLIGTYDVLMLDEPTNHLDMRTINWLATHLKERWSNGAGALLVVTHDRWFLDEVCTSMWEVHDGCVDPFEGGYSAYILQRVERDRLAQVAEDRRRNMARKELAWLSRGAQARSTKPKFRVEAARALIADVPPVRNELELKRLAVARLGKQVIDVLDVTAGYTDARTGAFAPVVSDATWLIGAGDRFGLLGENGAGKSTMLSVIQGALAPVRGRVKIGQTVRFGVLSQQLDELAPHMDETIREVLSRYKRVYVVDGKETSPEKLLERLGFTTKQLWSRISDLSGGQRRRLSLLLTILDEPNVLILDEPGNDLDTDMLAIVEDLLDSWPGTLILVTHDRYLMERVTDHQYALIDGRLRHVPGGVDEYLRLVEDAGSKGQAAPKRETDTLASKRDDGLSNTERQRLRREVSSLERKMESRRAKVEELKAAMAAIEPTDYAGLIAQQQAVDAAAAELDGLETAWLEASERLDG